MKLFSNHPNTTAASGTGALMVLVAWLLGHYHVSLTAEEGAALAAVGSSLVLAIGKTGLKGLIKLFWNGQQDAPQSLVQAKKGLDQPEVKKPAAKPAAKKTTGKRPAKKPVPKK